MVEVRNRKRKVMIKPNIVRDYNAGMSRVDRFDQMLSYYSALRKTIRWPKKLAVHIFEMMIHDAYLLYCQESGSKMKSLSFGKQLVLYLLKDKLPSEPTAKRRRNGLQPSIVWNIFQQQRRNNNQPSRAVFAQKTKNEKKHGIFVLPAKIIRLSAW